MLDADGSILTTRDKYGNTCIFVDYFNSDKAMLQWIENEVQRMGYQSSLRINKDEGVMTKKYHIVHRRDYLQLSIYGMDKIYEFLARLHPQHPEKIRRRSIACATFKGQRYSEVEGDIQAFRSKVNEEKRAYILRAQQEYARSHQS